MNLRKEPTYYRALESAAGNFGRWSLDIGRLYVSPSGKLPDAWKPYLRDGLIEQLPGHPGYGFDVITISDRWFEDPPADPVEERPIHRDDLLKWLGWDLEKLSRMRARYGFPQPVATFGGTATEENPDAVGVPGWLRSQVERWLHESREIVGA